MKNIGKTVADKVGIDTQEVKQMASKAKDTIKDKANKFAADTMASINRFTLQSQYFSDAEKLALQCEPFDTCLLY